MKIFASILFILLAKIALSQEPQFKIYNLSVPDELSFYDNQFSGLSVSKTKLFMLSESRLQDVLAP